MYANIDVLRSTSKESQIRIDQLNSAVQGQELDVEAPHTLIFLILEVHAILVAPACGTECAISNILAPLKGSKQ